MLVHYHLRCFLSLSELMRQKEKSLRSFSSLHKCTFILPTSNRDDFQARGFVFIYWKHCWPLKKILLIKMKMSCWTQHTRKMIMSRLQQMQRFTRLTQAPLPPNTHAAHCEMDACSWWARAWIKGPRCLCQTPLPSEPHSVPMQQVNRPAWYQTEH